MLAALALPLWWIVGIPNEIRHAILESRAVHDPAAVSLDYVEEVRWYERGVIGMEGDEAIETFFVIVYLGGRYRVVLDTSDHVLKRRLTLASMLPSRPRWLGTSHTALAWIAWFVLVTILVAIIVAIVMVLQHC